MNDTFFFSALQLKRIPLVGGVTQVELLQRCNETPFEGKTSQALAVLTNGGVMTSSQPRSFIVFAFTAVTLISLAASASGCASLMAAAGLSTLDSTEAVAIAQRNLCGGASDTTCAVHEYRRVGGRYIITLDRRPPAGNDRVIVTLRNNGTTIEAAEADSLTRKAQ